MKRRGVVVHVVFPEPCGLECEIAPVFLGVVEHHQPGTHEFQFKKSLVNRGRHSIPLEPVGGKFLQHADVHALQLRRFHVDGVVGERLPRCQEWRVEIRCHAVALVFAHSLTPSNGELSPISTVPMSSGFFHTVTPFSKIPRIACLNISRHRVERAYFPLVFPAVKPDMSISESISWNRWMAYP